MRTFWLGMAAVAALSVVVGLTVKLTPQAKAADAAKPIKAFYITGGGYHDYKKHAPLLTGAISEIANVEWTISWDIKDLAKKGYADAYDVVVYNMCSADEKGKELIDNVTSTHKAGKAAVVVHCALHSFRDIAFDDWRDCCGLTTKVHDRYRALEVENDAPDHAITKFFPAKWKTEGDELYQNIKFWPNAKSLLKVYSVESKKHHVVAWANSYGKGRIFGTTLGHDMKTAGQKEYHQLLANGLLWAVEKLEKDGKPSAGYEGKKK